VQCFTFLLRGDLHVADLVRHTYPPRDAPRAYQMLQHERATAMGVIFDWSAL
jgi:hypothetical protein